MYKSSRSSTTTNYQVVAANQYKTEINLQRSENQEKGGTTKIKML